MATGNFIKDVQFDDNIPAMRLFNENGNEVFVMSFDDLRLVLFQKTDLFKTFYPQSATAISYVAKALTGTPEDTLLFKETAKEFGTLDKEVYASIDLQIAQLSPKRKQQFFDTRKY